MSVGNPRAPVGTSHPHPTLHEPAVSLLAPLSFRLRAHTQVLRVRRRALGVSTALIAEPFAPTANSALTAATSAVGTACAPDVAPAEPPRVCGPRFRRH